MPMIHVAYFTDPLCPWSWAAEPALRRFGVEFSGQVQITYVMVGMARQTDSAHMLAQTLEASAASGMPADARVWLEGSPRSSHPACLAVKAAAEQGCDAAFLRRLRVGVMTARERIDNPEAFLAAARDVPGLDVARLDVDMRSNAIVELFGADREQAQGACGDHRPSLPAFSVDGGDVIGPEPLRDAVVAAGGRPGGLPAPAELLARAGGPLATAEIAAATGLSPLRARIELWRLAAEHGARPAELPGGGELWLAA